MVLVPERRDWSVRFDYLDQVEWEYRGLETCSILAFWVPRNLDTFLNEWGSSAEEAAGVIPRPLLRNEPEEPGASRLLPQASSGYLRFLTFPVSGEVIK
jgi:hypothetical protein